MSLAQIQLDYKQQLERHLETLMRLQAESERTRDLAASPTERERHDEEVRRLKASIATYKGDLADLEADMAPSGQASRHTPRPNPPYRVDLNDDMPLDERQREFRAEVEGIVRILDYEIDKVTVAGTTSEDIPAFVTVQEGDFESRRSLFGTTVGLVDERQLAVFRGVFELNRPTLALHSAILVTNTYATPTARQHADQWRIQILTFGELLDRVFKFTPYLKKAIAEYEAGTLRGTYVDVKYLRRGSGTYPDARATADEVLVTEFGRVSGGGIAHQASFEAKGELTPFVDAWTRAEGGGQICLLGDYGTGKTSFATQYFWRAATAYLQRPVTHRIPLLVPLNRYHTSTDVEQMMTAFLVNECGTRRDFRSFLRLAERGKFLVILDGFDEMAKQVDVNVRRRNFRELAKLAVGRNKVILSGRPNYFLTHAEIDELFTSGMAGGDPYRLAKRSVAKPSPRYELLSLALFDRWQIEDFLQKQSAYLKSHGIDDWRELQDTIYRTYNLEELARTPVLLEIIIKTLSEIRSQVSQVADINAAKLYEIYTSFWLDREYDDKGDVRWLVRRQDKELFVLELAWSMLMADSSRPEIHFSLLSKRVRDYFELERAMEIEYFSSDIRFCSYLVHSETDGTYRFVHKSFMEYFCARYLYESVIKEREVGRVATSKWLPDEVFFFLCQLAGDEGVTTVIELARAEADGANRAFLVQLGTRMLRQFIEKDRKRGSVEPAAVRVRTLLEHCKEFADDAGYLWGLLAQGDIDMSLGRLEAAHDAYRGAFDLAKALNHPQSSSRAMLQLGRINQLRGDHKKARERFQVALAYLPGDDASLERFEVLIALGESYRARRDVAAARQCFEEANRDASILGMPTATAKSLEELGSLDSEVGMLVEALHHYRQAIALYREVADRRAEGAAVMRLAEICEAMGLRDDGEEALREALAIFVEVRSSVDESRARMALARNRLAFGRSDEAEQLAREALAGFTRVEHRPAMANALLLLGDVLSARERHEEALAVQKDGLAISIEIGDYGRVVWSLVRRAATLQSMGRLEEAHKTYEEAVSFQAKSGYEDRIATNGQLGDLASRLARWADARSHYRLALAAALEYGAAYVAARFQSSLGDVEVADGNLERAETFYEEAAARFEKLGDVRSVTEVRRKMASLSMRRADWATFKVRYARYHELVVANNLESDRDLEEVAARLNAAPIGVSAFNLGRPLGEDDDFWGRKEELRQLTTHLLHGQNVVLVGDRRSGKTSLFRKLAARLESPPFMPILIDLQAFPPQTELLFEGILREVVSALTRRDALSSPDRWNRVSVTYATDFGRALASLMAEVHTRASEIRLILLLDEADVLASAGAAAAPALRQALSASPYVAVLLGMTRKGIDQLRAKGDQASSPLLGMFVQVGVNTISQEDLTNGVTRAMGREGLDIGDDALQEIYDWSGGIPWIAQFIGHHAAVAARDAGTTEITGETLAPIRARVLEAASLLFQSLFDNLDSDERRILRRLLGRWRAGKQFKRFSPFENHLFASLAERGILVRDGEHYRIASALFEEWLRGHIKS
jgi:tetratricopeptide (TPR) repeat protein